MMRKLMFLVLGSAVLLTASASLAATLDLSGGQLLGATGVNVDGGWYDVAFVDGTCIDLFSGCDQESDFVFQTGAAQILASQALLDQVFLDIGPSGSGSTPSEMFDTEPTLTAGCSHPSACFAVTVTFVDSIGALAPTFALNDANEQFDQIIDTGFFWFESIDTGQPFVFDPSFDHTQYTYAVWTISEVPEPATGLLVCMGLLALSAQRRRRPAR